MMVCSHAFELDQWVSHVGLGVGVKKDQNALSCDGRMHPWWCVLALLDLTNGSPASGGMILEVLALG